MSKATKVGGAEELGWQKIVTFMDKGTLNRAQAFSKLHNIVMHQLINSAVKVFISEAEAYVAEQAELKKGWYTTRQPVKKNTESFRITDAYATEDVMKAHHRGDSVYPKVLKLKAKPRSKKKKESDCLDD